MLYGATKSVFKALVYSFIADEL